MTSISNDISSFNRLLNSFEDKISLVGRTLEEFKKMKEAPKVSMRYKEEFNAKSDKEILNTLKKFKEELLVNYCLSIESNTKK